MPNRRLLRLDRGGISTHYQSRLPASVFAGAACFAGGGTGVRTGEFAGHYTAYGPLAARCRVSHCAGPGVCDGGLGRYQRPRDVCASGIRLWQPGVALPATNKGDNGVRVRGGFWADAKGDTGRVILRAVLFEDGGGGE